MNKLKKWWSKKNEEAKAGWIMAIAYLGSLIITGVPYVIILECYGYDCVLLKNIFLFIFALPGIIIWLGLFCFLLFAPD